MIQDLIKLLLEGKAVSKEDTSKVFSYLRHIPNARKTENEWNLYCQMAKERGLPRPDRDSKIRPLHEKYK